MKIIGSNSLNKNRKQWAGFGRNVDGMPRKSGSTVTIIETKNWHSNIFKYGVANTSNPSTQEVGRKVANLRIAWAT